MKIEWPSLQLRPINLWNAPHNNWRIEFMTLTYHDIKDKLKMLPETDLMEILEISSEDLVERFGDKIEEKRDYFELDLED